MSWATFIRAQLDVIVGMDFFTIEVVGLKRPWLGPAVAGNQLLKIGFDFLPRGFGKHLGHPSLVHVGEVDERAQSEADVFAWILAIPGAHQIWNAHATHGEDGVQIDVIALDGALADGRELHGAEVFQGCDPTTIDFLDHTDHVVSVSEDAVFEAVHLPKEGTLIVLTYRNRETSGLDVVEQFRWRNRIGGEPVKVGRDAVTKLERDG
jgi:hypothetical protein